MLYGSKLSTVTTSCVFAIVAWPSFSGGRFQDVADKCHPVPRYPSASRWKLDGYGTIDAPTIWLAANQARHLARQITEILGL